MKKIVVIALIALGAMSVVSCKNSSKNVESAATVVETETVVAETSDSAAVAAPADSAAVEVENAAE